MSDPTLPAAAVLPTSGSVNPQQEVCAFGVQVTDAGPFHVRIEGSAPLAATLVDTDGMTVSTLEDGGGANPLDFDVTLTPGAYTLRVRAAQKGAAASMRVQITPLA